MEQWRVNMTDENGLIPLKLDVNTLSTLIAGLYSVYTDVNPIAIPTSVWLEIAEKLSYFMDTWDYEKITLNDWIKYGLLIYPKEMFSESEIEDLQSNSLYWERVSGNAILVVSMDIREINNVQ